MPFLQEVQMDKLLLMLGETFGEKLLEFIERSGEITEKGIEGILEDMASGDIDESLFSSFGIDNGLDKENITSAINFIQKLRCEQTKDSFESSGISPELYL